MIPELKKSLLELEFARNAVIIIYKQISMDHKKII